mmetsp:Transcript_21674/g.50678  ORF Transcript_21674/g.50678 Transcript_21674/m.50678 type:complete len:214 (-) Transcript_21674:109-750(-)
MGASFAEDAHPGLMLMLSFGVSLVAFLLCAPVLFVPRVRETLRTWLLEEEDLRIEAAEEGRGGDGTEPELKPDEGEKAAFPDPGQQDKLKEAAEGKDETVVVAFKSEEATAGTLKAQQEQTSSPDVAPSYVDADRPTSKASKGSRHHRDRHKGRSDTSRSLPLAHSNTLGVPDTADDERPGTSQTQPSVLSDDDTHSSASSGELSHVGSEESA